MSESEDLQARIIEHLSSAQYRPLKPSGLARALELDEATDVDAFRQALKFLMQSGQIVRGVNNSLMLQAKPKGRDASRNQFTGTYRHNKRGFGFVVPLEAGEQDDLFIPEGQNGGALTGDTVRAAIVNRETRDGKPFNRGRIIEILERGQKRFVGSLSKTNGQWIVYPDGNTLTEPILTPDAASRHIKPGTKVVVELTSFGDNGDRPQGVITEVLGMAGEKDVDLKSVIVEHALPGDFPERVKEEARRAVDSFDPGAEARHREDLGDEIVCTIDPDDAKDYDDAISLRDLGHGQWELGVHIADVSYFVKPGTALDEEARARGNSTYFPGYVIPMLPEVLSNGVCSLQEGVPRLCKTAFITYDEDANPIAARFANTIIKSRKRLRYTEAQALIDGATTIPHPDGPKTVDAYEPEVLALLRDMNDLAKRLQARRRAQGQLVLDLPSMDLVLDDEGRVIDAVPEDESFTHTLIEMFMVEGNEAVARLLDSHHLPFLRRAHEDPDAQDGERIRHFAQVTGYHVPKVIDRKALQMLLVEAKGKPDAFAINMAVLKSLARAEYSPETVGHYALASTHYCHFTSPIRRYADLTIHRLLDAYFEAQENAGRAKGRRKGKLEIDGVPSFGDLVDLGRHISFTERRSEEAERELRKVKILTLLKKHIGEEFGGVVSGVANFGLFVQLNTWLAEGLIRYEDLMDDWWEVDVRGGFARGERTGKRIAIGDVVKVVIVNVDLARRELNVAVTEHLGKPGAPRIVDQHPHKHKKGKRPLPQKGNKHPKGHGKRTAAAAAHAPRGGGAKRHKPSARRRGR